MTSRERFLRAVAGEETDRLPFYYRGDGAVTEKLRKYISENRLGTFEDFTASDGLYYTPALTSDPPFPYFENINDIYSFRFADGGSLVDVERCKRLYAQARESKKCVYGGAWATLFTKAREMTGQETFLISLYEEPELIKYLIDSITDVYLGINKAVFDACAQDIDVFYYGIDLGTQRSLFFSREHYIEFFADNIARLNKQAHEYGIKTMFHSCGSVYRLIDLFIDECVDILDPVQVSAADMSPEKLTEFKEKIAFHGGISTQDVLPFGTPEQVTEAVKKTVSILGPSRFIVSPDQEMIGDVPPENVAAMIRAIR